MRLSDLSSDVCSSDLAARSFRQRRGQDLVRGLTPLLPLLPHIPFTSFAGCGLRRTPAPMGSIREAKIMVKENPIHKQQIDPILMSERFPYDDLDGQQYGRASCRERVCTYVLI